QLATGDCPSARAVAACSRQGTYRPQPGASAITSLALGRQADRAKESEAASQHHVAVGNGEVGRQAGTGQQATSWPGHRQERRGLRRGTKDQRAVSTVLEDLLVGDRTGAQLEQVALQFRHGEFAGMVFEKARHLAIKEVEGQAMEIA